MAGWEFRVGELGGGQLRGVFLAVANCQVIPLVPIWGGCGGSLLGWVQLASGGYCVTIKELCVMVMLCI